MVRRILPRGRLALALASAIAVIAIAGIASAAPPKGDAGTQASNAFAQVKADGSLVNGKGVVSAERTGSGHYQVKFDHDISACAPEATPQGSSGTAFGLVELERFAPTSYFVGTLDITGAFADRGFSLAILC
jgi:hypothetical protein